MSTIQRREAVETLAEQLLERLQPFIDAKGRNDPGALLDSQIGIEEEAKELG